MIGLNLGLVSWWISGKLIEIRISQYFPRQFNARAKALGSIAYKLRKSNPPLKTSIEYTNDDLILHTCPRGQYIYSVYNVDDLPPVDFTSSRSPPSGRTNNKRNRSSSHSPPVESKKVFSFSDISKNSRRMSLNY